MSLFVPPQASDIAVAISSSLIGAPFGTTSTVDTLGASGAVDGSAGNVVARTYYCTQAGVAGTIVDTFTYGVGSVVNGNPTGVSRGAFTAPATGFTTSLSATTEAQGSPITVTFTPSGGAWPAGVALTPVAQTIAGTFSPATLSPVGSAPVTCTFTPSNAATGSISATAVPTMTNLSGGQADTSTAVVATTISSAVINAAGTQITLTFNQAVTLGSGFALTVAGTAIGVTFSDAATNGATHVGTLASTAYTGQAATYATTATTFTSPSLGATATNATVTNNSTVAAPSGNVVTFSGAAGAPTGNQVLAALGGTSPIASFQLDGAGDATLPTATTNFGTFQGLGTGFTTGTATMRLAGSPALSAVNAGLTTRGSNTKFSGIVLTFNGTTLQLNKWDASGGYNYQQATASVGGSTAVTSIGLTDNGGTYAALVNGAQVATFTEPGGGAVLAAGGVGVGSTISAASTNKITQFSFV